MWSHNVGDICLAKVYLSYNGCYKDGRYKTRPILIIGKVGRDFYKCLTITSKLKDFGMDRIDIYTNYNFDKHSQIICNTDYLIKEKNIYRVIDHCRTDDFAYILNRYKELKEK